MGKLSLVVPFVVVICPVSLWRPEAVTAPDQFRPKPQVPSLVGHLPQVSYVCLIGQLVKGKMIRVIMEWGTPGAVRQISWHLPYD